MTTTLTQQTTETLFAALSTADPDRVTATLGEDVTLELPRNQWNAAIPFLGRHVGREAVLDALSRAEELITIHEFTVLEVHAQDDVGYAHIVQRATHQVSGRSFEVEALHRVHVTEGQVDQWRVYFDPAGQGAAFREFAGRQLVRALHDGDEDAVITLLAGGADANQRDEASGLPVLALAAGRGYRAAVRALLAAGADVHAADAAAGATALHKACQGGSLDVVRVLVAAGAHLDSVVPTTGHTPLMEALWFKEPDIVGYLLDQGAAVDLATHYGFSMAEHLGYEIEVNITGKDCLVRADELIKQWRAGTERTRADHPLLAAVADGDVQRAKELIAQGADVEVRYPRLSSFNDQHTPLLVAARDGHTEIVRALLSAGADVNAVEPVFGAVPLHKSVYNGRTDITRMLVAVAGVDLDFQGTTNGYTPLHDALWHGYEQCASALLDAGARVDLQGHDGKTPHVIAAEVCGAEHPLAARIARQAAEGD